MLTVEQVARMCHQLNREYCQQLDDWTQLPWSEAPDWQTESAINGVQFHLDNPDAGPEASHENWYSEKLEAGWSYGAIKNPELKQHPCCIPFDELPLEQQAKDKLFKGVVDALRELVT